MSEETLDVYRDWLGITETARPLDHYRLLRLKRFEDGTAKIRDHYRKMNLHVRKFATGDYAKQSQELLNELAKAMLCLTDLKRKREYDASLGRTDEGELRRRSFEEILLAGKVIDQNQLAKARDYAAAVGLEVRDAVLQQKLAGPDVVMSAYAESIGLPYVELDDIGVDQQLVGRVPAATARQHSCVPVMTSEGQLLVASPNPLVPNVEEDLRLRFGMPVRTVLCTPAGINGVIAKHYPRDAAGPGSAPGESKAQPAAKQPDSTPDEKPLSSEERTRRQLMLSMITFNVAVILLVIFFATLRGGMAFLGFFEFAATIVLAMLAGAAALVVGKLAG